MDYLKNNPLAATIVFIVAIIALAFSIYWTFLRGASAPAKSPFEGIEAPQVQPGAPQMPSPEGQQGQQSPMAF